MCRKFPELKLNQWHTLRCDSKVDTKKKKTTNGGCVGNFIYQNRISDTIRDVTFK